MGNSLYIGTTESGSGKALIALGTIELILRKATKVSFFRPVIQTTQAESKSGNLLTDRDSEIINWRYLRACIFESFLNFGDHSQFKIS
jgi:phosphate acetyltransferase